MNTDSTRAWVRLPSGKRLDLLNPTLFDWEDEDLAIGLARTYRWGGHSAWPLPLSVAQHSLAVLALRREAEPTGLAARAELRELLHALLAISAEQVGTSGRIAVSTAEGLNLNGSLFVEVRVRDFGRGMDAARVSALFAPDGSGVNRATPAHALALARSLGGSLPVAERAGDEILSLPLSPAHSDADIADVLEALERIRDRAA